MKKFRTAGFLRLIALALLVAFAWAVARDRLSGKSWGAPLDYNGDAPYVLSLVKATSEGDSLPLLSKSVTRLGAPYNANWNDFPIFEEISFFLIGMMAKFVGVFQASNLGVVLAHVASAISFYLCCRFLKHRRLWSFVGAVLFSFTYYHSFRNLGHLLLAFSYTLPWAMLSCWLILSSKRMRLGDRLSWICLLTAFVMGVSNPYNLNMYAQLLCLSIAAHFFIRRRTENLKIGILSLVLIVVAFVLINLDTLCYSHAHGKNDGAMVRNYFEAELYALKPIEFVVPPKNHNVGFMAAMGEKYASLVYVRGEIFAPYLGIIGTAALVWMFIEAFFFMARIKKGPRRFPAFAPQTLWILAYSVIGGIHCMIMLAGIKLFRGSNRYSIVISTLIMLFLVSRLSRLSRRWSTGFNLSLAGALLLVGIYDQLPRRLMDKDTPENETAMTLKSVETDHAFAQQMESQLKPGAMVFQLPVMVFPESTPSQTLQGYELLRPYLHTKTLRFSFGANRGRPQDDWQWDVQKMPATNLVATLEKYGFAAIYINRRGFADQAEGLLKQLAAAGRDQFIEDTAHEQVCVFLKPSATPELPTTAKNALINFKTGWSIVERTGGESRQWSAGNATLTFFNEGKQFSTYSLNCQIGSLSARHVSLRMKDREIWSGQLQAGQSAPLTLMVDAKPGNNTIEVLTDQPAAFPKDARVPLAVMLMNLEITKSR